MKRIAFFLSLLVLAPACADRDGTASADSEVTARTDARRVRLRRLASVDALARLYVGHELRRDELLALGTKSESAVIDALAGRSDFRPRYAARVGDFLTASGKAPVSTEVDPGKPIADAFGGAARKAEADRFARWLVQTLAPLVASEVIAKNEATLAQMTYRELLDTVRRASEPARRP
jgi:hypothetical protein